MKAKLLAVVSAAAFLSACANMNIPGVRDMADEGSAFDAALHQNYADLAQAEYDEADWADARYFTSRSKMAAAGQDSGPQMIAERTLPEGSMGEIEVARADLLAALDGGGRDKAASPAARAQTSFDCWMQELEENIQQEDIDNCRSAFYQALAIVQAEIDTSPVAKAMPMAMPVPMNVYFGFDKSEIDSKGMSVVDGIAEAYAKYNPAMISLVAYADRAGDAMYNDILAKSRVDAVVSALRAAGVPASKLAISISGEANVPVSTADGVAEQGNRVVTVTFEDGM
ncbi:MULTISPECIES: OmpA family protein [Thalassospira]|uniref:OmpA family protein n=1 Tax=Thalassospira lucentensis TaxID=168935 RepID=A0A358HYL3_9PROT|nr:MULTISPECIES: OmpA family protein [Thalassospira]MBV16816.1 flagellar motor protein MotB [Thalassospira sp.]HBU99904.1 OmpA family protein [Thalassospira lucentensis]HCW68986.1 OmpA family protein [Thalassospira lucentensis]|tara:strand:+ start:34 stop:885 length:852 start_codon:yes stop_codon:yes gene_type:complete